MEAIGIQGGESGRTRSSLRGLTALFTAEACCSAAGTLLSIGTSFYMKDRFGWQLRQNFLLAAGQGLVYVPGALLAARLTARFGRRTAVCLAYLVLVGISIAAWAFSRRADGAWAVASLLMCYTFVIGTSWPALESMVAAGDPRDMPRRLAAYNIIWPAAGAAAIAVEGAIIRYRPAGVFLIPAAMHLLAFLMMAIAAPVQENGETPSTSHPAPEPELLRKRKLALWLSRTALPATYTVIYGLMPIVPFLAVMRELSTSAQTAVASVWLVARWLVFIVLAIGSWWHTRPRLMLWAAVLMLIAFFGMTLPPTHGARPAVDLGCMILWQIVLGAALGFIYSGSLYFGMVLSEGSTEHGGYHEALIGLGWVLGPAVGAAAEHLQPGEVRMGVAAVGSVIALSVLVVLATGVRMSRERPTPAGS